MGYFPFLEPRNKVDATGQKLEHRLQLAKSTTLEPTESAIAVVRVSRDQRTGIFGQNHLKLRIFSGILNISG